MTELDPFVKVVIVGDSGVGKTWFLSSFVHHKLPHKYAPTLFDNMTTEVTVEGVEYELSLWDTSGAHENNKLRQHSYQHTDVFIVCYSVDNRASFENVRYRWLPELRRSCPGVPRILLALKSDLAKKVPHPVTTDEGEMMQLDINSPAFFQFSVTTPKVLPLIFDQVVRAALHRKYHCRKNSSCSIQ